jgi:large subunit ribosomal protein L31e
MEKENANEQEKPETEEEEAEELDETVEEAEGEEEAEETPQEEVAEETVAAEAKAEEAPKPVEETPTPVEEEEAKPSAREEKAEEEEIVEEKIYTIPLGRAWIMPANKRAPRAMRMIRSFVVKHMKFGVSKEGEEEETEEPKKLIVSNEVNERVWGRGIEKPPRNIRVRAAKDKDGNVTVYLAEGD